MTLLGAIITLLLIFIILMQQERLTRRTRDFKALSQEYIITAEAYRDLMKDYEKVKAYG